MRCGTTPQAYSPWRGVTRKRRALHGRGIRVALLCSGLLRCTLQDVPRFPPGDKVRPQFRIARQRVRSRPWQTNQSCWIRCATRSGPNISAAARKRRTASGPAASFCSTASGTRANWERPRSVPFFPTSRLIRMGRHAHKTRCSPERYSRARCSTITGRNRVCRRRSKKRWGGRVENEILRKHHRHNGDSRRSKAEDD